MDPSLQPADMIPVSRSKRFVDAGKWYVKISFTMIVVSILLFALSALLVRSVTASPEAIIVFAGYYLVYHGVHAAYGIFRILKFVFVVKRRHEGVSIGGTFLGIALTPVSFGVAYLAFFFLALSSCAA